MDQVCTRWRHFSDDSGAVYERLTIEMTHRGVSAYVYAMIQNAERFQASRVSASVVKQRIPEDQAERARIVAHARLETRGSHRAFGTVQRMPYSWIQSGGCTTAIPSSDPRTTSYSAKVKVATK